MTVDFAPIPEQMISDNGTFLRLYDASYVLCIKYPFIANLLWCELWIVIVSVKSNAACCEELIGFYTWPHHAQS